MKKFFVFIITALSFALVSCKTVTMEDQIDNIFKFANSSDDFSSILEQAHDLRPRERADYYMYVLSDKLKLKDIWSQSFTNEDSFHQPENIVAEIKGTSGSENIIIVAADISHSLATVAAIKTIYTLKKSKINHNNTIRLVLYDSNLGYEGYHKISKSRGEANLAVFEISDNISRNLISFKSNERIEIFESVDVLATQYCKDHFPVKFEYDEEIYTINPHYAIETDPNSNESFDNVVANTSAIASIICLLN